MTLIGSDLTPYIALVLVGFLPSEIWRWLGVIIGQGIDEASDLFLWVKAVATATLAAVVAKLAFLPSGTLADLPIWLRVAAISLGVAAFFGAKRSVLVGVIVGEGVLMGSAWALGLTPRG
jgi:hypothetical protein